MKTQNPEVEKTESAARADLALMGFTPFTETDWMSFSGVEARNLLIKWTDAGCWLALFKSAEGPGEMGQATFELAFITEPSEPDENEKTVAAIHARFEGEAH